MKIGYLYPEFQCPYCGVDIEDKGNVLLRRAVFQNVGLKTRTTCGNCHNKILLWFNDMEGKLVPVKIEVK